MAENVIITAGSGMNVTAIDAIVNIVTTGAAVVDLESNTFYTLVDSSLQTLNLPLVSKFGDVVGISGTGSGLFKVAQRVNEQILYGITETTIGTFGTFESTQMNDVVYLRRMNATGLWLAHTTQGDFLIDAAGAATLNNSINNVHVGILSRPTRTSAALLSAEVNKGYILTRVGSLQQIFLPIAPLVGDRFLFQGNAVGLFRIDQSGSQQIFFGNEETVLGAAGYVASTHAKDGLYLMCTDAPNEFTVLPASTGNFNMNTAGGIVSQNAINEAGGAVPISLSSTGVGGDSIVSDGVGPDLSIKNINANLGLSGADVLGTYTLDANVASIVDGTSISSSTDANNNVTVNNTAPDQTVVLSSGTGISNTGAYPNFTVTNTAPDQTVVLTAGTDIDITGVYPAFTINSTGGGGGAARSWGEIYKTPDTNNSQFISDVFWEVWDVGTFFAGPLTADFTWDDPTNISRLIYTGVPTKTFNIEMSFSGIDTSARFQGSIHVNGVLIDKSISLHENAFIDSGNRSALTTVSSAKVQLSTNDYIEPFFTALVGATLTLESLKLDVNEA